VSLYPPTSTSTIPDSLIPPVYDPFFLPAPFIPSHPHLRDLCYQAVRYLHDSHTGLEDEVKHYIAMKSTEMRTLEEKVRAEVEILWEKYREGPGRGEERQRSRSTSSSRSNELRQTPSRTPIQSKTFSPPTDVKDNPILAEAASSPIMPGSSLLSASLSANAFYAQAPSPIPDPVDDSIDEMSKRVDTRSDARAVAMSHVFSVLDDAMGVEKPRGRKERMNRQELKGKDSWIDDERRLLARRAMAEDESQGSTPRRRMPIKLPEGNGQTKERAVKFEEPEMSVVEEDGELEEDQVEPENGDIDRDGESPCLELEHCLSLCRIRLRFRAGSTCQSTPLRGHPKHCTRTRAHHGSSSQHRRCEPPHDPRGRRAIPPRGMAQDRADRLDLRFSPSRIERFRRREQFRRGGSQ